MGLKFKEETSEVSHLERSYIYSAVTWLVQNVDWKYVESFEMWCWQGLRRSVGLLMW
jgi:hypothetical protein